jgi:hypothetical protein
LPRSSRSLSVVVDEEAYPNIPPMAEMDDEDNPVLVVDAVEEEHAVDSHNTSNGNPSIVERKHAEEVVVEVDTRTEVVSGNPHLAHLLFASSFPCAVD